MAGEEGNDTFADFRGRDHFYWGDGRDSINASDFPSVDRVEHIVCGAGTDEVRNAGSLDVIAADCERVAYREE